MPILEPRSARSGFELAPAGLWLAPELGPELELALGLAPERFAAAVVSELVGKLSTGPLVERLAAAVKVVPSCQLVA